MTNLRLAFAAGILAALSVGATLFIHIPFVESEVARVVLNGLFVGGTVYIGLKILERTMHTQ